MQMKKYSISTLLLIMVLLSGCVPETSVNTPAEPTVVIPEPQINLEPNIRAIGKVVLRQTYLLSFPISGTVKEMLVEEGQYLEAGDVIARLDTTALDNNVTQAEDALAVAQANYERVLLGASQLEISAAENRLEIARTNNPLSAVQATQQAIDIAGAEAQLAYLLSLPLPEEIAVAKAQLKLAGNSLEIAKKQLELAELSAPMDCMVINLFVQNYEYTTSGKPVIEISDPTDLVLNVEIDDRDFNSIKVGDKADVFFDALPGLSAQAEIVNIRYNYEKKTGFIVELILSEPPPGLLWGMSLEVKFLK